MQAREPSDLRRRAELLPSHRTRSSDPRVFSSRSHSCSARGSASPIDRHPRAAMRPSRTQKTRSVSVAPIGSKRFSGSSSRRDTRLPAWPIIHSRPPQPRTKGCVFASVFDPQMAVRMWSTNSDDSRCSQALTSSPRMLPRDGAGSLRTDAEGSPGRVVAETPAVGQDLPLGQTAHVERRRELALETHREKVGHAEPKAVPGAQLPSIGDGLSWPVRRISPRRPGLPRSRPSYRPPVAKSPQWAQLRQGMPLVGRRCPPTPRPSTRVALRPSRGPEPERDAKHWSGSSGAPASTIA